MEAQWGDGEDRPYQPSLIVVHESDDRYDHDTTTTGAACHCRPRIAGPYAEVDLNTGELTERGWATTPEE